MTKKSINSLIGYRFFYILLCITMSVTANGQNTLLNAKEKSAGEVMQANSPGADTLSKKDVAPQKKKSGDKKTIKGVVKDENGEHLALFYADFFPRASKRGGAWMTEFRGQSIKDGVERRPFIMMSASPELMRSHAFAAAFTSSVS